MSKKKASGKSKSKMKIAKVMDEFKKGELHSGKGGPVVKKPKQAIAIAISVSKKKRK
jgi:ribosomal protein L21E